MADAPYHDKQCCCICWEDMSAPYIHLKCGHRFHAACLEQWSRRSSHCPMCRDEYTWHDGSGGDTVASSVASVAEDAAAGLLVDTEYWWEAAIQLVVMMSGALTAFRCLALFCPRLVDALFQRYIVAGKELSALTAALLPRVAPYLSVLVFGALLCI